MKRPDLASYYRHAELFPDFKKEDVMPLVEYIKELELELGKTIGHMAGALQALSPAEETFYRTYAREKPNGSKETFNECVARVVAALPTNGVSCLESLSG